MGAKLTCVSTGSSANGYVLQCGEESLIIECGCPIKDALNLLNYDIVGVQGIIVTHSHG